MPAGTDPERHGSFDDALRRRARLGVLVQVGFWMAAMSLLLGFPLCFGCGVLLPQRLVPWVLLAVPTGLFVGIALLVSASAAAQQIGACPACQSWLDEGGDAASLRRCPQCGRWGQPGRVSGREAEGGPDEGGRGFPVVMREASEEEPPA